MSHWRVAVMVLLIGAPLLILAGIGSYYLWLQGWAFYAWMPMAACMVLGYVLGWRWQRQNKLLRPLDAAPPMHWTDRDREAWRLVEARGQAVAKIAPEKLGDFQFYIDTGREMAMELARFYHPNASNPLGGVTVPEFLTVIELAAHDLGELVDQYLPAGHLMTVDNWRQARKATEWYQKLNNAYWLISAAFSPVNTGIRYATAQIGMSKPWQMLQQNLTAWFYLAFVDRLGRYLIDLNSGRLRVGAGRYRELIQTAARSEERGAESDLRHAESGDGQEGAPRSRPAAPRAADAAEQVRKISLLVFGQVKAGKSSFINAVLGAQGACTDILPATADIKRYELHPPGISTRLEFLDTPGYGLGGPNDDELRAVEEAARQADLLLLVVQANNPARQADLDVLLKLRRWFASRPELRMPPVLAIMTHIDLLSPALEWKPPYNWREPTRPKEQSIHDAWDALRDQLGDHLVGIVPLCTAADKVYGIEQWFLPTLTELLDEAHAVALLRCLRAEADTGKVRKVFHQLLQAGKGAAKMVWENYQK